jgi:hypothetical protein
MKSQGDINNPEFHRLSQQLKIIGQKQNQVQRHQMQAMQQQAQNQQHQRNQSMGNGTVGQANGKLSMLPYSHDRD